MGFSGHRSSRCRAPRMVSRVLGRHVWNTALRRECTAPIHTPKLVSATTHATPRTVGSGAMTMWTSIEQPRDLITGPDVIRHASGHRGRSWIGVGERLVSAPEVVVHEMQANHRRVVLDLLGEPVGEAGKAAHAHPHRQVLPLDVRG